MHFRAQQSLLVLLGLLAINAYSIPTTRDQSTTQGKRSFIVPRVPRDADFRALDGPAQVLKAYRKHNMPVPRGLREAVEARQLNKRASALPRRSKKTKKDSSIKSQSGPVPATPYGNGVEYVSPITIGGQHLTVDFDTGSADLWVFGAQLDEATRAGHEVYSADASRTAAVLAGSTFNCTYGDGSGVTGTVYTDEVAIGGVVVARQAVGVATAVSSQFADDAGSSGLVGLAFSSLNRVRPQAQRTFFDNVVADLAEPVFTADLRKTGVGAYEFGSIDESRYAGDAMAWVPINASTGFWQFASDKFAVGEGEPDRVSQEGAQAIVDTGTTAILAHPAVVQGYYAQVQGAVNDAGQGGFVFPCTSDLPNLTLDIGGVYKARIPGEDIRFAQYNDQMCFGGLQATTSKMQIYGDIFLKSQFVAFNGGNMSIGFAEHSFGVRAGEEFAQLALANETTAGPGLEDASPLQTLGRPAHGKSR